MHKTTFYTIARLQNLMTEFRHTAAHLPSDIRSHIELPIEDIDSELYGLSQSFLTHVENSAS